MLNTGTQHPLIPVVKGACTVNYQVNALDQGGQAIEIRQIQRHTADTTAPGSGLLGLGGTTTGEEQMGIGIGQEILGDRSANLAQAPKDQNLGQSQSPLSRQQR